MNQFQFDQVLKMKQEKETIIDHKNIERLIEKTKNANPPTFGNSFIDAHVAGLKAESDKYEWARVKKLIDSLNEYMNG